MSERPSSLLQTGFSFVVEGEELPGGEGTLWEASVTVRGLKAKKKGFAKRSEAFLWAEETSYELRERAAAELQ